MFPLAYFFSFRTYGSWLHGDPRGSVDRRHNQVGDPIIGPLAGLHAYERTLLKTPPVELTSEARSLVLRTITEVCAHRGWTLHAVNPRTNHVHAVVAAPRDPGRVLGDLKAWCTRRLREHGMFGADDPIWAEDGSKRYLRNTSSLADAVDYVLNQQDDQTWRYIPPAVGTQPVAEPRA